MNSQQSVPQKTTPSDPQPQPNQGSGQLQSPQAKPTTPTGKVDDIDALLAQGVSANTLGITDTNTKRRRILRTSVIPAIVLLAIFLASYLLVNHYKASSTTSPTSGNAATQKQGTAARPNEGADSISSPSSMQPNQDTLNANPDLKSAEQQCSNDPLAC